MSRPSKPGSTQTPPDESQAIDDARAESDIWYNQYERGHGPHGSLTESLHYFTRVFEEAPAAYVITDPHLLITNANAEAQRLFGRTFSQLKGRPIALLMAASDTDTFRRIIAPAVLAAQEAVSRPLRLQIADGEAEIPFSASVMRDSHGLPQSIAWVFHDRHKVGSDDIL